MPSLVCLVVIAGSLAVAQTAMALSSGSQTPSGLQIHSLRVPASQTRRGPAPRVCAACIRAHEEFLASDAMQGRGSGTHDEQVAASYVASQLQLYGIEPAGDDGTYIQRVPTIQPKITGPAELIISNGSQPIAWTNGKDFVTAFLTQTEFSGPLQKIDAGQENAQVRGGAVVLITGDSNKVRKTMFAAISGGAAAVLILASKERQQHFAEAAAELPKLGARLTAQRSQAGDENFNLLRLSDDAFHVLEKMPDGATVHFAAPATDEKAYTWNAVGILRGTVPALQHSAILLSAHLDHLGIGPPVNGDNIYNGADDDASGTTAVLELARVLGHGPRPRRTVLFALFGSEEAGFLGSSYLRAHPPLPLTEIAANLEFEMIGRPDPAVKGDTLWLTGWERSNLGPVLTAHGAHLVADPHTAENFFAQSDNYVFAKEGVVAQTVSSYGLHKDYHQPSDDLQHLDFKHMDAAIASMLGPIHWLVNSDFKPKWNPGGKP